MHSFIPLARSHPFHHPPNDEGANGRATDPSAHPLRYSLACSLARSPSVGRSRGRSMDIGEPTATNQSVGRRQAGRQRRG